MQKKTGEPLSERATTSEKSLVILPQGCQGQVTTVDLWGESMAPVCSDNADIFMNIYLAKVTYMDLRALLNGQAE